MNEALLKGVHKYWEDVRSGARKSPKVIYAENKAKKVKEVNVKYVDIEALERRIKDLKEDIEKLEQQKLFSKYSVAITNKSMVSIENVLENAISYDQTCGIYFLVKDSEILYVGQSVCVFTRIRTHENGGRIKFNRIAWVECNKEHLDILESLYIHMFKPSMNGSSSHDGKQAPLSMEQIAKFLMAQDSSDIIRGRKIHE